MGCSLSASAGDEQATRMRYAMAQKMPYDQIQEARRQARTWQDQHNTQ
jgi:hypothetical protein